MIEMDIENYNVNAVKGCDLFEYDLLKPLEKSIGTIKNITIFYLIITILGFVIMWSGIAASFATKF